MKYLIILFMCLMTSSICSQGTVEQFVLNSKQILNVKESNADSLRKVYFYSTLGLAEYFSVGIGYQINPKFAASFKYGWTWVSYGGSLHLPGSADGLGLELNYFTSFWVFNNFAVEYIHYLNTPLYYLSTPVYDLDKYIIPKGNYFELLLGNEDTIKKGKGKFKVFWKIGIGVSSVERKKTLIMPSIKIGITQNLF